jgi:uncharacterized metal-binding protein YceD (DUF177 family)
MKKNKIRFNGLSEGRYDYDFKLQNGFFEGFEESEIRKGDIDVKVEMIISKDLLTLTFKILGRVEVQCDRCLEYFDHTIDYSTELYVEFGDKNSDLSDADNKIILNRNENEIVLDKHLYDYIHLSLPFQRVHPEDAEGNTTCNADMLKKIEDVNTGNNHDIDPRWDKLKDLYN